jgi:hypothetical protein
MEGMCLVGKVTKNKKGIESGRDATRRSRKVVKKTKQSSLHSAMESFAMEMPLARCSSMALLRDASPGQRPRGS